MALSDNLKQNRQHRDAHRPCLLHLCDVNNQASIAASIYTLHTNRIGATPAWSLLRTMATDRLATLPQELQHRIITDTNRLGRLALFRTCKQLRNAVLSRQSADCFTKQQQQGQGQAQQQGQGQHPILRTRLFLAGGDGSVDTDRQCWVGDYSMPALEQQPESSKSEGGYTRRTKAMLQRMPAAAAARLLRLAATASHDVHLYLRQTECPQVEDSSLGLSYLSYFDSFVLCHFQPADPSMLQQHQQWLTEFFSPWLMSNPITPSLKHLTALWLQDMQLPTPLPDCIRQACPNLKQLELYQVQFPAQINSHTTPWPQLQQLTLHSINCTSIARLLTPTNLPGLISLRVLRCNDPEGTQGDLQCCRAFRSRLTSLTMHSSVWPDKPFRYLTRNGDLPQLVVLDLGPADMRDQTIKILLTAAPALQRLSVGSLQLWHSHADKQCSLQYLYIANCEDDVVVDVIRTITRLPRMPWLQRIELGYGVFVNVDKLDLGQLSAAAQAGVLERVTIQEAHVEMKKIYDTVGVQHAGGSSSSSSGPCSMCPTLQKVALLRPVIKAGTLGIHFRKAHITEELLCALGVVHAAKACFHKCTWEDAAVLRFWETMPDTNKVELWDKTKIEHVRLLCTSATRSVVVAASCEWVKDKDYTSLKATAEAAGNGVRFQTC